MAKSATDDVLMEFPGVGKYRVRLVRRELGGQYLAALDVREYAEGERFTGFTRRGIRLYTREEAAALRDVLEEVTRNGALPKAPEAAPAAVEAGARG